jgi:Fic family protein
VLRALQFMMCGHELDKRPGRWRAGAIFVRNEATSEIVYEGPDVALVPALVDELVADLGCRDGRHPVVRAAMAHLNLVMIHPFRDGNGRMSRCLQTLVLGREERTIDPVFSSIEEYLAGHTAGYYQVLSDVGGPRWDPARDARPWVRFCLTAHLRSGIRLRRRIRETEALWSALEQLVAERRLPERTIDALAEAARGGRVRNHAYRTLVGLNEQQASRDLRALAAAGLLEARGEARGRLYVGSPELIEVHHKFRLGQEPAELADPFAP